jgi:hypothetical protein
MYGYFKFNVDGAVAREGIIGSAAALCPEESKWTKLTLG